MSADEQDLGAGEHDRPDEPEEHRERGRQRRGRSLLGAVAGLFLGIFVAIDLQQFAIRPLDNLSVIGLPVLGLALGLALGKYAPLRRRRAGDEQPAPAPAGGAEPG